MNVYSEIAAEGLREEHNALGVGFFLLLRSLVGLHFDLLHDVLEAGPFCRINHLKLKAELPPSAPPDNRCLNLNWGFVLYHHDPDLQSGSWLNVGETFDATTPEGEIDDAALSTDYADGRKRTAKLDGKPEVLSLLHHRASQIGILLPLYIPDRTQF